MSFITMVNSSKLKNSYSIMNLADPELELIDPTPNVHSLFLHFDKVFFWAKLSSRAVVRWSKRMYSCAGICSYEGRGGLCDIALSEPLLKLRPRKDLIETLLHEMIHAYLFITRQDRERDGHGPNFQAHMHRINKAAGINISIYHSFHDEVELYQTHWWRCNGPCQKMRPYFGVVRRTQNRAPGPKDYWWSSHQKNCGGTFLKIKEPDTEKNKKKKEKSSGNIKKYVTTTNINTDITSAVRKPLTPIVRNATGASSTKLTPHADNSLINSQSDIKRNPHKFITSNTSNKNEDNKIRNDLSDVTETVRNIWANKQLPTIRNISPKVKPMTVQQTKDLNRVTKTTKHKTDPGHCDSPSKRVKRIDDYFKTTATNLLKDVYGEDFKLTEADNRLIAETQKTKEIFVDCPICNQKVKENEINRHIDECLNKDVIEKLSKDSIALPKTEQNSLTDNMKSLQDIVGKLATIPAYKKQVNSSCTSNINVDEVSSQPKHQFVTKVVDLTNINNVDFPSIVENNGNSARGKNDYNPTDTRKVKSIVKGINYDKNTRKSDNFIMQKGDINGVDRSLSSLVDEMATAIKPTIKIEPSTSVNVTELTEQRCPCCSNFVKKPMAEHLDECLAFFDNNTTVPEDGASTSFANNTIIIDEDVEDIFDETLTLNATGTKTPCPCCMNMIEMAEMNEHLDTCLS